MHCRCFLGQASRSFFLQSAAAPRSYRVQTHKETSVCRHVEEVHARKWKLYAPTQDTALHTNHPLWCVRGFLHFVRSPTVVATSQLRHYSSRPDSPRHGVQFNLQLRVLLPSLKKVSSWLFSQQKHNCSGRGFMLKTFGNIHHGTNTLGRRLTTDFRSDLTGRKSIWSYVLHIFISSIF
jgi:hypothetical protein